MSWFKTKVKLTEENEEQKSFIERMLSKPSTVIEINPTNMAYYLINGDTEVEIDSVGIQIDGECFTYSRKLESGVIDLFKTLCKEEATKRRSERHEKKVLNTIDKLNSLKNNL